MRKILCSTFLVGFLVACVAPTQKTHTSPSVTSTSDEKVTLLVPTLTITPSIVPTSNQRGVSIEVVNACSNGEVSIVYLQTELDTRYWDLDASDFGSFGDVYFETASLLSENGQLFSSTTSSSRDGPYFDPLSQIARAIHKTIYPKSPIPNSQFMLTAEVTLLNLPSDYRPPTSTPPITFAAPGMIIIPLKFTLPVTMTVCRYSPSKFTNPLIDNHPPTR